MEGLHELVADIGYTHLDGESGPFGGNGGCLSLRGRRLSGGVGLHSGHEAVLCSVLCHLSQETRRPAGGGLKALRQHI